MSDGVSFQIEEQKKSIYDICCINLFLVNEQKIKNKKINYI